ANKNSIRILYGNHVAENIDFRSEPQQHVKKGIRGWSRRADNRRAFSAEFLSDYKSLPGHTVK
ncbi:hypothetical protein ACT4UM_26595, partial [Bacillus sp. SS-TM]